MKAKFFLIFLSIFGFFSCKKSTVNSDSIVGSWRFSSATGTATVNGKSESLINYNSKYDLGSMVLGQEIVFKSYGTGIMDQDYTFKYSQSANMLKIQFDNYVLGTAVTVEMSIINQQLQCHLIKNNISAAITAEKSFDPSIVYADYDQTIKFDKVP